ARPGRESSAVFPFSGQLRVRASDDRSRRASANLRLAAHCRHRNEEPDVDPTHPETDDTVNPTSAAPGSADRGRRSLTASSDAQAWLTQLQAIMDDIATQSAPVAREIGAKAAELAALAAERAGPL